MIIQYTQYTDYSLCFSVLPSLKLTQILISSHTHHLNESPKICYSLRSRIGEEEGVERGGLVNNHSLKKMNQAYVQIK